MSNANQPGAAWAGPGDPFVLIGGHVVSPADGFGDIGRMENGDLRRHRDILAQRDLLVGRNASIEGTEVVEGDSSVEGNQTVQGNQTVEGNASVVGTSNVEGLFTAEADATLEGALFHDGATAGFYGNGPIAQPAAVPVTAAGIHAALVSLGLIS